MKVKEQLALDEVVIDDKELERLLEARQKARDAASSLVKTFKERDAAAKLRVKEVVKVGVVARIGRFRVERVSRQGRHVEFDTASGERLRIEPTDE